MAGFTTLVNIEDVKVRALFDGTSGSGKTVSAIRFAYGLVGPGGKVGAICSEGGRINRYALRFPNLYREIMTEGYHPDQYVKLIEMAEAAKLDALVIDSVSHEWSGRGGIMEMLDTLGSRNGSPWKVATPLHRKFTEKMLTARLHVIVTCRTDTEWVYEKIRRGDRELTVPRKVGMKLQQRPGFEYDVDLWFRLDDDHRAWVQKTNFDAVFPSRVDIDTMTEEHGEALRAWLAQVTPADAERIEDARREDERAARAVDDGRGDEEMQHVRDAAYGATLPEDMADGPESPPVAHTAAPATNGTNGTAAANETAYEVCTARPGNVQCDARLYPAVGESYGEKTYTGASIVSASRKEFDRVLCGRHLMQAREHKRRKARETAGATAD